MESILMQNIGERIREARKMRNINQADLADMLHIATSHMSAIERGQSNFSVDILLRLVDVLQVSADWLLFSNTPDSSHVYNQELDKLLSGCTPDEVASIMKMAKEVKEALQNAKQIVQNK